MRSAEHTTVIPDSYFNALLDALATPPEPNENMARALDRARDVIEDR
jgi:uncharacterized protein (DUF1778 family)